MHKNFCNQLQWLEPLLLTTYFTGDEYAPGSNKKRTRGSYRVMIIGWGNFAGTDIRLLDTGIGRYAKTPTYWRDNFKLYESEKLDPCIPPSAAAKAEKAITTLSSDIRTFGSTDPLRPDHRESGIGMTVPAIYLFFKLYVGIIKDSNFLYFFYVFACCFKAKYY